jgi:hypothetical protein
LTLHISEIMSLSCICGLFHLTKMSSMFTHVIANVKIHFFLWLNNIPLCVCITTFSLHIHQFIDTAGLLSWPI